MKPIKTYIVDSFTDQPFKGNPAGVCVLSQPISDLLMQSIAIELNHSETAFVSPSRDLGEIGIRYFSPKTEIPLCGHATLAAAKVMLEFDLLDDRESVQFRTSENVLLVARRDGDTIEMEFPVYDVEEADVPQRLLDALGVKQCVNSGYNRETKIVLLEIASTDELRSLQPDFAKLVDSHSGIMGVLVTAAASDGVYDFHSRFFWPWSGGDEDPVTGATHTFLAKYWSQRQGKTKMNSFQASARTGSMEVELLDVDRMLIRGRAVMTFQGELLLSDYSE